MFGLRKRIAALEQELVWLKKRNDDLLVKIYSNQGDITLIVQFLGASFEDVNERRLVKKGGPEKGS